MGDKLTVGIVGCGNIAPAYVRGCAPYDVIQVAACSDLDPARAEAFAAEHGLAAMTPEALLADPAIDIVINLTIPKAHAQVSMTAVKAGKHLYSEKPLAITREAGRQILDAAAAAGVRVGCAPDTFLGGGLQTCRKLIDDGAIGEPVAAAAFLMSRGPESWHPNPKIFYERGAGPLFDMGPYYLTALVNLLGPVTRLTAMTRASFPERIATSEARYGQKLPVEVATHSTGLLSFASGPIATMITSFDVHQHTLPRIEIYGAEGTLSVPDPNTFGGPVRLWQPASGEWQDVPLTHRDDIGRGTGVADMAAAILNDRPHRASGALAYHVLDLMAAFDDASERGAQMMIQSWVERPAALPPALALGALD